MNGWLVVSSGGLDGLLLFLGCVGLLSAIAFGPQVARQIKRWWRRQEYRMACFYLNYATAFPIWDWGDDDEREEAG